MVDRNTEQQCSLCEIKFTGYGNNPEPFAGDRCCDDCNDRFVVPVRMILGRHVKNDKLLRFLRTLAQHGRFIAESKRMISAARQKKTA